VIEDGWVRGEASLTTTQLSHRFRPALLAFFLRRLRNHAEAEDLTQEALMRIAQRSDSIDPERPDAYVFQVAANLLRDRGRRLKVRASYQEVAAALVAQHDERDPYRVLQSRESLVTVLAALKELPERTRTIFILFRLESMKHRDIADMLGVSVRTVENHVVQASVHLRNRLGPRT
jgi:RNA polymerase sigma factor (sigma-70 family)